VAIRALTPLLLFALASPGCQDYWSRERPAQDSAPAARGKVKKDGLKLKKDGPKAKKDGPRPDTKKPKPDTRPPDKAIKPDKPCPAGCNTANHCVAGKCVCFKGWINPDKNWNNGCEKGHPTCSAIKCDKCPNPKSWCGPFADCRKIGTAHKCRCSQKDRRNLDLNWTNGCEAKTTNCNWNSCNNCYKGFCGPNADCKQNKCTCIISGMFDCNGVWEKDGCECLGGCNGTKCK